jgi:hypothetical protein
MSYVEDIEKINKLAKELMKHGMATNLVDAVSKAQSTLKDTGNIGLDITDLKRRYDAEQPMKTASDMPHIDMGNSEAPRREVVDISWQDAMAKNTKYIVEQLQLNQAGLTKLNADLEEMRKMLQELRGQQAKFAMPVSKEQVINMNDEPAPVQRSGHEPKPDSIYHPKQGNFKPEDVSIEKMFYFGNK